MSTPQKKRGLAELSGNLGDLVAREAEDAGRITEIEIEIQSSSRVAKKRPSHVCAINNSAHWNWMNVPKH